MPRDCQSIRRNEDIMGELIMINVIIIVTHETYNF